MIRATTHGRRSLDDVMRTLGRRFTPQRGITGRDIEQAIHEVCSCDAHSFFEAHVRGAQPLDFDYYLRTIGMRTQVSWSPALGGDGKPQADIRLSAFNAGDDAVLRVHLSNPASVWGRAGLHTGDQLVSLDGQPVTTATDFRSRLGKLHIGDTARVEVRRDGILSQMSVLIKGYDRPTVKVVEVADATPEQLRLRTQWLTAAR